MTKPLIIALGMLVALVLAIQIVIPAIAWHLTTHAHSAFTEQKFAQVRLGMRVDEVRRILGEPLSSYTNQRSGVINWYYTAEKDNPPFWYRRWLEITGETVIAVESHIWVD